MSAEESSPLEGARSFEPERPFRIQVILIVLGLVLIIAAYAYIGTREQSLEIAADELISQQQEDGLICCTFYHELDGESRLLVVTRELEGEFRRVVLRIMAFDDDGSPREINAIGSPFDGLLPTRFSVVDETAYIPLNGEDEAGVWMVDLSDPAWPADAGFVETAPGTTRQIAADDDLLAVHHTNEIAVLDITDRADPRPAASLEQPESGFVTIKMVAPLLFVNDAVNDEFRVFDLSTPDTPERLGVHVNPDGPGDVEIAFGADDAADRLDQSAMPSKYLDFAVDGDLIYIAASDLGLRVLDVSDPRTPEIVAELEIPDRAIRVAHEGDRLYLLGASAANSAQLTYAIHTVDISDPLNPQLDNTINDIVAEPGLQAFDVVGNRAFVGLYDSLLVFDVGR